MEKILHEVDLDSLWLLFYRNVGKRCFDIVLVIVSLLVIMPILVLIAGLVFWQLGLPVFFSQPRLGRNAKPFQLLKFRTMMPERRKTRESWVGPERRSGLPSSSDPRHTRFGQTLRRWSLDELPQIIQVLQGHLSLVGPRPELLHRLPVYTDFERTRFEVRPGLTGIWQVIARDKTNNLHDAVDIDIAYVKRCSFGNDIRILSRTVPALIWRPASH